MTKKLLSMVAFISILIVSAVCTFASDSNTYVGQFDLNDYTFYISEDGQSVAVGSYVGDDTALSIPQTVEYEGKTYSVIGISDNAFKYCEFESVVIPETVTYIGESAFEYCRYLTSINVPEGVTKISDSTFRGCFDLTEIKIPETVKYIGDFAFCNCSSLTEIKVPEAVTYIGDYAFAYCYELAGVEIPVGITNIGASTFAGCYSFTEIKIPETVTYIGESAFKDCSDLISINIPDGITEICNSTFEGCYSLTEINIPESVTYIGDYSFNRCTGLTEIRIPKNVTYIGCGAFYLCNNLGVAYFDGNVPETWGSIYYWDDPVFDSGRRSLVLCFEEGTTGWTSPTWEAPDGGFHYVNCCRHTDKTEYPYTYSTCSEFGHNTYYICNSCDAVLAEDGYTETTVEDETYTEYGDHVYENVSVVFPTDTQDGMKEHYVCESCGTYFDDYYGDEISVEELVIKKYNDFIYSINEDGATATIEGYLGSNADVIVPDTINGLTVTVIGIGAFSNNIPWNLELNSVVLPGTIEIIDKESFANGYITEVVISDGVTTINDNAFSSTKSLRKITIPGSVQNLGDFIFMSSDITEVIIEDGVPYIGVAMFSGCDELTKITIPESVKTIEYMAFEGCDSLEEISLPGVEVIEYWAFHTCENLSKVTFSDNLKSIESQAFEYCTNLTGLIIPESVESLEAQICYGCDNLKSVYFYGDVPEYWGSNVFPSLNNYPESELVLYYLEGKEGWTSPTWTAPDYRSNVYNTEVFVPCEHSDKTCYPAVETTCQELGHNEYYICNDCGLVLKADGLTPTTVEAEQHTVYTHKGGAATCEEPAICDTCGEYYGEPLGHVFDDYYIYTDDDGHGYVCHECGEYSELEPHYGGTASCYELAECEFCFENYGEYNDDHVYNMIEFNEGNAEGHWHECIYCDAHTEPEEHIPGPEATEEAPQVCTVCGYVIKDIRYTLGDINDDGEINLDDVVSLLRHVSKASVITDPRIVSACDVDGNGVVNLDDVVRLLRFVSKAIPSLR